MGHKQSLDNINRVSPSIRGFFYPQAAAPVASADRQAPGPQIVDVVR